MFVLVFNNTTANVPNNPIDNTNNRVERNSRTKSSLPRVNITNYNVLINGRNFYDQSINDLIKHHDEIKMTRRSRLLYNRMLVRLSVFQRSLQSNCS